MIAMQSFDKDTNFITELQAEANRLGFALLGITTNEPPPSFNRYSAWIEQGKYAQMDYLARSDSLAKRKMPSLLLPDCTSVISLALPYANPAHIPPFRHGEGRIAAYALDEDYHQAAYNLTTQLVQWIQIRLDRTFGSLIATDNQPILERDIAVRAGLGWIGKNGCLVSTRYGSHFFLVEVLTDLRFENMHFPPVPDRCGNCRRCIAACPTGCIGDDRSIDANRCISYLTIEHKTAIPRQLRASLGQWIFGCDICQIVCPWNSRSKSQPAKSTLPISPIDPLPLLTTELRITSSDFIKKYGNTPIFRTGRSRYLRNVAVALGNSGDPEALPLLEACLIHETNELIRVHAAWAMGNTSLPAGKKMLESLLANENSSAVREEMIESLK